MILICAYPDITSCSHSKMITKAVLYSDYIADLTVHLLKDQ